MCGRPIHKDESIRCKHGPVCNRKYIAMGSPVQTEFEFRESRLFKPGMSLMEQHRKVCEVIRGR